jgi:subtilisin family serine protease
LADIVTPDGKPIDEATTAQLANVLATMPMLTFAEKNLILDKASVFPSDEFYTFQWHYAAIDVPSAWDITTGIPDVVAAVIDTGILFDHPDLGSRVVGGADLIDSAEVSNDGDGRDDDGNDVGDNACGTGCHSHHGSHCAGTMAAASNNGLMVLGIAWEGGLLAVRVLGEGGGSLNDIADGIEWAIGNDVDGVARNARPADVINMSLGGTGRSAVMAMSIEKSSSRFTSCAELPVTSRTDSFGCFSRKRASSGRMCTAASAPMVSCPSSSVRPRERSSMASVSASNCRSAMAKSLRPMSVSATPEGALVNNCTP